MCQYNNPIQIDIDEYAFMCGLNFYETDIISKINIIVSFDRKTGVITEPDKIVQCFKQEGECSLACHTDFETWKECSTYAKFL